MAGEWQKWVAALAMTALVWYLWRRGPKTVAKGDVSKSLKTIGILALILIVAIGLMIMMLKS